MSTILFGSPKDAKPEIAILIKSSGLNRNKLESYYITPTGLPKDIFIAWPLVYETPKKVSAKFAKAYLQDLLPSIQQQGVKTLLVADGSYFKYLTGQAKVEPFYGEVVPCIAEGYTDMAVILIPNFQALVYNPLIQEKMDRSLATLLKHREGTYSPGARNIIKHAWFPKTVEDIQVTLRDHLDRPALTCDIEALSLNFWEAGISTVAFGLDKHTGFAFAVDRNPETARAARRALKAFFRNYKGRLIFHNASYDIKVLVYNLWMKDLADYEGMIEGINCLTRNFEDTKLITYLATNNAIENTLGLKETTAEYTGNYAEDVTDTSKIPLADLLVYNVRDALATWYSAEKHWPILVKDLQQDVYEKLMKPTVRSLLAMEICGMPINPEKVQEARKTLEAIVEEHRNFFENNVHVKEVHYQLLQKKAAKMTEKAKKKVYTVDDSTVRRDLEAFNPGSEDQVRHLLYDYFGLPVLDLTDGKLPATGAKTIKKLVNHTQNPEIIEIIENLRGYADANIILTTFIPAFEKAQQLPDGSWRLYGNFNLGGTQSLRLSSSNPNLQNLPANSKFAKLVKACFEPIPGWLFVGSDFDSLEDKINVLITKDPNKQKVYTDGFDGHCLRAHAYFTEQMLGIDPDSVTSINSIKKKYKSLRQDSKAPTFALTYGGTHFTLMNNNGFSEEKAKTIEARYHELYKVADQWIADRIEEAKTTGYVLLAFGARIRTPLLAKSVPGTDKKMPYGAKREARSAGNAATQSYCVLTLRALNEFMERVWASPYRTKILPSVTVHDAVYFMCPDNAEILHWINVNLLECMAWDDLPELKHPIIKITSALDVFWPNWSNPVGIPVGGSVQDIKDACRAGAYKYHFIKNLMDTGVSEGDAMTLYQEDIQNQITRKAG